MNKLKARFKEDPYFATVVIVVGVLILSKALTASASMIEASAYARSASKF